MIAAMTRNSNTWNRLRQTVAEMNYATRRMVELQARPVSDTRHHH